MLTTTNFKLKKPESTDYAKISDINDNMDIIDAEIAKRPTRDDMDDVIDTKFTVSTSRAKLTPGEKLKVLFGKIERWLEDLKDGAFSTVANNLTTTGSGSVLDARQGKALKDQVDTKANKADVVNNLTTTDYGYILDARQGKVLNDKIDSTKSSLSASVATKLASANVVNNVTTADAGYALDARQGKALSDKIDSAKSSLQTSFQAGVDGIYNAIVAQGTTPASKSQGDVKVAIGSLATAKYNQGVTDADNRVNSSSANYKGGYNAGYSAGLAAGRAEKKTIVIQLTGDKTAYGDLPGGTIHLQSNVDWTVSSEGNGIGLGNSRGTVYAQVNQGQSRSSSGSVWINMGAWGTLTIKA